MPTDRTQPHVVVFFGYFNNVMLYSEPTTEVKMRSVLGSRHRQKYLVGAKIQLPPASVRIWHNIVADTRGYYRSYPPKYFYGCLGLGAENHFVFGAWIQTPAGNFQWCLDPDARTNISAGAWIQTPTGIFALIQTPAGIFPRIQTPAGIFPLVRGSSHRRQYSFRRLNLATNAKSECAHPTARRALSALKSAAARRKGYSLLH
ncbi:hypothetical protein C8J57DRAFT_1231204 [Mycena rebaudengoi]|nr:hypothetical protein C8J57DRAFT_1231204 [Mycena rebaudengoi]